MSTVVAEGVDYAFTTVDPRALYAAGKRFAMRYIGPGSAGKHLTAAERDEHWAAGLGVVLLAEGLEGDIFAGRAVGRRHAQLARAAAAVLGAPATRPIYYAADKDVTAANIGQAVDYFRGVNDEEPATEVGCYGDIDIMTRLRDLGLARWFYQAAAGAWSHGLYFPYNTVHQYHNGVSLAGGTVDLDRAYAADYGQWLPDGGDMPLTQADADLVAKTVWYRNVNVDDAVTKVTAAKALDDANDGVADLLARPAAPPVDVAALAAALAADTTFTAAIAKAVNDDAAKRLIS